MEELNIVKQERNWHFCRKEREGKLVVLKDHCHWMVDVSFSLHSSVAMAANVMYH